MRMRISIASKFCVVMLLVNIVMATNTCDSNEGSCRTYEITSIDDLREKLLNDKEFYEYITKQMLDDNMDANLETTIEISETKTQREENLERQGFHKQSNNLWYKYFEEKLDYQRADESCKTFNARLISTGYYDPDVRKSLHSRLADRSDNENFKFWVGIRQNDSDPTQWDWSDCTSFTNESNLWLPNEPNDQNGNERCGINKKSLMKLNDVACGKKFAYICEAEP